MTTKVRKTKLVPPDGGWGWVVLFSAVVVNFLIPGTVKSFGVLFVEFLQVFKASPTAASWMPALCYFLYSSLGPLSSVLSIKYSYKTVTLIGGAFAASGMMLSCFATSVSYLYVSYGLMVGIGAGLTFPPTIYIVTAYFERLRGFANGLCISGSAIGTIVLPPFLQYLLNHFGHRGAVLIMGAITLNTLVCGLLYHPVSEHMIEVFVEGIDNEALTLDEAQDNEKSSENKGDKENKEKKPIDGNNEENNGNKEQSDSDFSQERGNHLSELSKYLEKALKSPSLEIIDEKCEKNEEKSENDGKNEENDRKMNGSDIKISNESESAQSRSENGAENRWKSEENDKNPVKTQNNYTKMSLSSESVDVKSDNCENSKAKLESSWKSEENCTKMQNDITNISIKNESGENSFKNEENCLKMGSNFNKSSIRKQCVYNYCENDGNSKENYRKIEEDFIKLPNIVKKTSFKGIKDDGNSENEDSSKEKSENWWKINESRKNETVDKTEHKIEHSKKPIFRDDDVEAGKSVSRNNSKKSVKNFHLSRQHSIVSDMGPIALSPRMNTPGIFRRFFKTPKKSKKSKKEKSEKSENSSENSENLSENSDKSENLEKFFDFSVLRDPIYLVILISNSTSAISNTNFMILLPSYAIAEGFDKNMSALLLSIVSALDLIGRIGGASLSDIDFIPKYYYFVCGLGLSGIALALLPMASSYLMLSFFCALFGLSSGMYIGITTVILADMLGTEKLSSSYGISLFVNGVLQLVGPPVCGAIYESVGSYKPIFFAFGIILILGTALWAAVPLIKRNKKKVDEA